MNYKLLLYLTFLGIGILIGYKELTHQKLLEILDKLQMIALIIILFVMGIRIGADENVIKSLGVVGVNALVITIFSIAFSIIFVLLYRKIRHIDKKGKKV